MQTHPDKAGEPAQHKAFDRYKSTDRLPSPKGIAAEVLRLTQSPDCSLADLSRTIQRDPALSARLLRAANAPAMAPRRPVVAVSDAVLMLGLNAVRQLVLAFSLLHDYRDGCPHFDYGRFWSQSLLRALAAQELSRRAGGVAPDELFVAGLLFDIGQLALATAEPELYGQLIQLHGQDDSVDLCTAERLAFGLDQHELTELLLADWSVPDMLIQAMLAVHADRYETAISPRSQTLVQVLRCAQYLAIAPSADAPLRQATLVDALDAAAALGLNGPMMLIIVEQALEAWSAWGKAVEVSADDPGVREGLVAVLRQKHDQEQAAATQPQLADSATNAANAANATNAHPDTQVLANASSALVPASATRQMTAVVSANPVQLANGGEATGALVQVGADETVHAGLASHATLRSDRQANPHPDAPAEAATESPPDLQTDAAFDSADAADAAMSLRVLLVDRDLALLRALQAVLEGLGHRVSVVNDGREALRIALQIAPEFVVCGRIDTGMDALHLARALRQTAFADGVYIVLMHGAITDDELSYAYGSGIDANVPRAHVLSALPTRLPAAYRFIKHWRRVHQDFDQVRRFASELKIENRRLRHAVMTDALTGLPNRRYALQRLEQEWSAARRRGSSLAVIMIDIDRFKQINDQYGHDVGDEVLKHVSRLLRARARLQDSVTRIGGEEFLLVCPDTQADDARRVAERLRQAVQDAPCTTRVGSLAVTISAGVAASTAHGQPGRDAKGVGHLVRMADDAVYRAKGGGRNCVMTLTE